MFKFLFVFFLILSCQKKTQQWQTPPRGGDFQMPSTQGVFNSKDYREKVIFLFFGFTRCPQVCPTTLKELNLFYKMLPLNLKDKVRILFVSVDPEDSLDILKERLKDYPKEFIGLTDTKENLSKILKIFGARYKIIPGDEPGESIIDHTSSIFVINPQGTWVDNLPFDTDHENLYLSFKENLEPKLINQESKLRRQVIIGGENTDCDLSRNSCDLLDFNVNINPKPIKSNSKFLIEVKAPENSQYLPVEVDIEGVEENMGFIRPKLTLVDKNLYRGEFFIPLCQNEKMNFKASLLLKYKNYYKSLIFHMSYGASP